MNAPIHIIERITTQPGRARELIDAIRTEYRSLAEARQMTLDRLLVSPPMFDDDLTNEVTVIWTVPNTAAWWQMAKLGRADRRSAEFWGAHAELIAERHRSMATDSEDVAEVCDV